MYYSKPSLKLLFTGTLLVAATSLFAQTTGSRDSVLNFLSVQNKVGANFTQGFEYDLPSDLKSPGQGDLAIWRLNSNLTYSQRGSNGFFRIGGLYEYSNYDWSQTSYFEDVNSFGFNGFGLYKFEEDEPWGIFGLTSLEWGAEDGASFNDGFSYLVAVGPSYTYSRDLRFGIGLGVIGSPQEATRYLPMPTLDWNINKHWNIRTFNGATVTYDLRGDRQTRFDISVQYDSSNFAIKAAAPPGRSGDSVVTEETVILIGGVTQQLGEYFFVRGYIQGTVYREYEFRVNRNEYLSFKTDPAVAFGFQIGASF